MKFATIGHLLAKDSLKTIPRDWVKGNLIVSPEMNIYGTTGYLTGINLTAEQMMTMPIEDIRKIILNTALFIQDKLEVDVIQLGALTTSVTRGGEWLIEQEEYKGFVNHGDSYTAAITCQTVHKVLKIFKKNPSNLILSIVGAYGVIGEAVSKMLVPYFSHSILIGRRKEKLKELEEKLRGNIETTNDLKLKNADIVITATNHPTSLLNSEHLKKHVIVIDVSQPPNLSLEVCRQRPDVCRIDGGYVDFPVKIPIPGMPIGKNYACIVEVIMQAIENERRNHVGSIDLNHLKKTEEWGKKHGFTLNELTNFGEIIQNLKTLDTVK